MANGPAHPLTLVSESELRQLAVAIARVETQISTIAEAVKAKDESVEALTARVHALELASAAAGGRTEVRARLIDWVMAGAFAIAGTGFWVQWLWPS